MESAELWIGRTATAEGEVYAAEIGTPANARTFVEAIANRMDRIARGYLLCHGRG